MTIERTPVQHDLVLHLTTATRDLPFNLVIHGGAGGRSADVSTGDAVYEAGLRDAYAVGEAELRRGGSALDAVVAAVCALEDDPLFNAGRGAALTSTGQAELDASVMSGDGRAGAVAVTRHPRNPVRAARSVMERTGHVLLVSPPPELLEEWGLETVDPGYFVTPERVRQLEAVRERRLEQSRHGTVGAVAIDAEGRVAAATSTGGMVDQHDGRVGDTPLIGCGTYARDGVGAVSCTGEGESFIRGAVAHDVVSRMRYLGSSLATAVSDMFEVELTDRGASGGVIAVDATGGVVLAHNSPMMFAAYRDGDRVVTMT